MITENLVDFFSNDCFTVFIGYKVPKIKDLNSNDLRHFFGLNYWSIGYINISNFEAHKSISVFNIRYCEIAPITNLNYSEVEDGLSKYLEIIKQVFEKTKEIVEDFPIKILKIYDEKFSSKPNEIEGVNN